MNVDSMKVTILDDGTIKVETDRISQANHLTAEAFMRNLAAAAGGAQTRRHKHGVLGEAQHALAHAQGRPHDH
jgi:hypothetical protein